MGYGRARRLVTESALSGSVDQSPGSKKDFREGFVPFRPPPLFSAQEGVSKELAVRRI